MPPQTRFDTGIPGSPLRAFALVLGVVACPPAANADEVTGTWTGTVQLTGNYYWERSTRVIAPELSANLDAPDGTRLAAYYLVDAITSASQATGVQVDRAFTEYRHEIGFGAGHEFDLGDAQLDLEASGRFSWEPDYRANALHTRAALFLGQRATMLAASFNYWHDRVGRVLRFADDAPPGGPGGGLDPWPGTIDGFAGTVGIEQIVTPRLVLGGSYDLVYLDGFLSNPYRKYLVDGQPLAENHPESRLRHALRGLARWAIPGTQMSIHGFLSVYRDDWEITGVNPELRVYQRLADVALLRFRYAFHAQSEAFFNGDDGSYEVDPEYGTNDPKMTAFQAHELGTELTFRLPFLETQRWNATLALAFDYIWRTNRFGDGVIAQAALRIPF